MPKPRCAEGVDHPIPHGRTGYSRHGCCCDVCREAARESMMKHSGRNWEWRERNNDYLRRHSHGVSESACAHVEMSVK